MVLDRLIALLLVTGFLNVSNITSLPLSELRSECPEDWLKYHNECYHPLPEFLKIYSPEAKERFCRVVLSADIGYVNGVMSCMHDLKGTSNVLVKIMDSSVNKRAFGNEGWSSRNGK